MPYVGGKLSPLFDATPAHRAIKRMADRGGDELHDLVTRNTPIDSGNLRTSWYREPLRRTVGTALAFGLEGWKAIVRTDVDYAPYVEWGTGLYGPEHRKYLILPTKPGGTLRWESGGQVHFAKRVWHPGSPGQHMMSSAAARCEALYATILQPELERWKLAQEAQAIQANVDTVKSFL